MEGIVLSGILAVGFSVNNAIQMNEAGYAVTVEHGKVIIEKEKSA